MASDRSSDSLQRDVHRGHRLRRNRGLSVQHQSSPLASPEGRQLPEDITLNCGWGRLIMAHTFHQPAQVARVLSDEQPGCRDIAIYVRDPHVILSQAPQALFLDPSHTYRMWLANYQTRGAQPKGFAVRRLRTRADAAAINRIYETRHMVPVEPSFVWKNRASRKLTYLVAEDLHSGELIGTTTGVDHVHAFADPEGGASLWCLAVDPQTQHPGVGEALVRYLIEHYQARGRAHMDLSVLHNNRQAIALYEKLGFQRVPVFTIKRKNAINEPLFTGPDEAERQLNPYARLLTEEARRRGIHVEVIDAKEGYFQLSFGGRRITCRESLTELTSAIAMSRCQNKRVTLRLLAQHGLQVPAQQIAGEEVANREFLGEHQAIVVKPADAEQGQGISVNLTEPEELPPAIDNARHYHHQVLLERYCPGEDLRIIVINFRVVAAAVRRPARIVGDGRHTINELIDKQSRRRAAATGGESRIPKDAATQRCVEKAGYTLDDILPYAHSLQVRATANLHTGGTIHDVTAKLHPKLREAAEKAARVLDIPVVGLDFLVPAVDGPDYVIIEANERPGLANHEPQPTAERFVDLLFPLTIQPDATSGYETS